MLGCLQRRAEAIKALLEIFHMTHYSFNTKSAPKGMTGDRHIFGWHYI